MRKKMKMYNLAEAVAQCTLMVLTNDNFGPLFKPILSCILNVVFPQLFFLLPLTYFRTAGPLEIRLEEAGIEPRTPHSLASFANYLTTSRARF